MSTVVLAFIGMWETVAILAVVLVLFGAKKLPELARGLGTGIKEFRKATREVNDDLQRALEEEPETRQQAKKLPTKPDPEKTVSQSSQPSSDSQG